MCQNDIGEKAFARKRCVVYFRFYIIVKKGLQDLRVW